MTSTSLPLSVYLSLKVSEALARPLDFREAVKLIQALSAQFFCGSPISTRQAMFNDLKDASDAVLHVCTIKNTKKETNERN